MDHLPIDSYCICIFFPLRPAFNNTYYCWWNTCILDLTLERVTFREECNIMMFSFLFYASNEIELRQIGQVLTEIWKSADSCISPSKPVRFASFLCHWMRKRNIRTLFYYNVLWMSAILMWKMEKYMDRNWWMQFATAPGNWIGPSQIELDGRPLFPSFTGSVLLALDGMAPGNWIRWSRLPGIEMENCWTQGISGSCRHGKMSDPGALNQKWPTCSSCGAFISQLHWVGSGWLIDSVFSCTCSAHLALH